MPPKIRAGAILAGFLAMTLPLMPVQAALLRLPFRGRKPPARHFPHWYHRQLCRLLGVRLHIDGALTPGVLVDDRIPTPIGDAQLAHPALIKRVAEDHDGVVRTAFARLLSTSRLDAR